MYIPENKRRALWEEFELVVRESTNSLRSIGALVQNPMDFTKEELALGKARSEEVRKNLNKVIENFEANIFESFEEGSFFDQRDEDLPPGGAPTVDD